MALASRADKLRLLLALLSENRGEANDRMRAIVSGWWETGRVRPGRYEPLPFASVLSALGSHLHAELVQLVEEPAVHALEAELRQGVEQIRGRSPFSPIHGGDLVLGRLCYAACRALSPAIVVETGVAHVVTSSFILSALDVNRRGELHSVDLPPPAADADRFVGALIPGRLKVRWHLHRGTSRRVMPTLLRDIAEVDVFIHDSLHTEENTRWELQTVQPHLQKSAVVISDDIDETMAFEEFVHAARPRYSAVLREVDKARLCGVAVLD